MTKKISKDTKGAAKLIRNYCAIQERCIFDVRTKLQKWGIPYKHIRKIIEELIHHNFINESRYAKTFCRGKFNIKKWGRMKIIYEMKKKNISEDDINRMVKEGEANRESDKKKRNI